MQGSDLIFIVLPVVIPLVLAIGVALPFIADSRAARSQPARDEVQKQVETRTPAQRLPASRPLERTLPGPPGRAA
jgi:hypothetical protein